MPSSQENNETITTFTLSFGGIEFCLSPSSAVGRSSNDDDDDDVDDAARRAAVMSIAKIRDGEVSIDLNGFVGTLRVWDRNAVVRAGVVVAATTEKSPIIGRNDDEDDDRRTRSGAGGLTSSSRDDGTSNAAAAAAAEAAPPNPVEDTPSPNAKGRAVGGGEEADEEEEEEKPAKANGGRRKKGQQQKLDFFGRNGNKRGRVASKTSEKSSTPPPKRRTDAAGVVDPEEEAPDGRKKSRTSDDDEAAAADEEEEEDAPPPPDDNIAEFEDFIEEESENDYSGEGNALTTLASLGQTMPSQDNESSMDGDGFCLDRKNKTKADNDDANSSSRPASSSAAAAAPCPRWGHTMTMIDHRRFVVYGGQTIDKGTGEEGPRPLADLHVHDLEDGSWTRPINCDGIARTWHTANFLPERRLLLCFGGEVLDGSTGRLITTDQVMVLDTEIMLWYPPTVSGQIPSGRSGHAGCFLPDTNELVVFGGVKNGRWLNSVAVLDTNRWRWSTPKAIGDAPRPRSYHSATVIGGDSSSSDAGGSSRVVIFGGNDGSRCFDSVHVLDAASSGGEGKRWVWSNPKCGGAAPSPRTGHVATLLNDGSTIMVYGGWDPNTADVESGDDLIFGDSYLLDTRTWTWKVGPRPRFEKSTAADPKNGGAERVGHSAVLAPGGKNGVQVLAFGGRVQGGEFVGDFQSLIA